MICEEIKNILEIAAGRDVSRTCVGDDLTFDWARIFDLLPEPCKLLELIEVSQFDLFTFLAAGVLNNYGECLKCKRLLDPVLLETKVILRNQENFRQAITEFASWTSSVGELTEIFDDFCADPDETVISTLLKLSPILEFALGNAFKFITGRAPPHLLKDLLQELTTLDDVFHPKQVNCKFVGIWKDSLF